MKNIVNAEERVLAFLLSNSSQSQTIFLQLNATDFEAVEHKKLFGALSKLYEMGKLINHVIVLEFILKNEQFNFINAELFVNHLDSLYVDEFMVQQYVEIVKNASISRQLQEFGSQLSMISLPFNNSAEKLIDLQNTFLNIINDKRVRDLEPIADLIPNYKEKLLKHLTSNIREGLSGIASGFTELDHYTDGFQPGDLIILAARPGLGKTALALNFLMGASRDLIYKKKKKTGCVVFFSLEMSSDQLLQRIICQESGIEGVKIQKTNCNSEEVTAIKLALSKLSMMPIFIDDTSDLTILELQTKLKQLSTSHQIELIIIDYLQLLNYSRRENHNLSRQQEVSLISRTLKILAKQMNCPIVALSQLSRKIEDRKINDKKPLLSDLRESGSIEQDADIVMFIYHVNEDLNEDKHEDLQLNYAMVKLALAKHRNGPIATIDLVFQKNISKFMKPANS